MDKQRLLYDIDTVAIWTPQDNQDALPPSPTRDNEPNVPISGPLQQLENFDRDTKRRLAYWKHWFLRRIATNISPLFLTTTVPSGLASTLTPIKSSCQISLSPDSQFLAVNHEDKIEFRTHHSGYEAVHALWGVGKKLDLYPKWRRLAWSPDSRLVARSFSDGTVEIVDVKGKLLGTIMSKDKEQGATQETGGSTKQSGQLFVEPLSFVGFIPERGRAVADSQESCTRRYNGHEYAYELVTITYDGTLRSYLFNTADALGHSDSAPTSPIQDRSIDKKLQHRRSLLATQSLMTPRQTTWPREGFSDPGFFCFYHSFNFGSWFRTLACATLDRKSGILCIGGATRTRKTEDSDSDDVTAGVMFWAMTNAPPYYQRYKSDGQLETSVDTILTTAQSSQDRSQYSSGFAAAGSAFHKLLERDATLMRESVHTVVLHEKYGCLSLDGSGTLTSWSVSREHGGAAKMSLDSDHLNYYARAKEHAHLSFQAFQSLVKEYHSNGTESIVIGLINGKCVSMRFWAKDAILLGFESGAMIVLQVPDLVNVLGSEPKVFASCLEFTNTGLSTHDEQVFVIEEITRLIRARVVGSRWIMMTEQEDRALGEPTEEEIAHMMGNEGLIFKWIALLTKPFRTKEIEDHRSKRQKLILVPKRTLSLYRLLRVPPAELLYRKLELKDYASALSIATTYELDADLVYQYQWTQTAHVNGGLTLDLLNKIADKEWVLANCIDPAGDDLDGTRALLEYGLQLTEEVMDGIVARCELGAETRIAWIRAAASGEAMESDASRSLLAVDLTTKELLWCKYRWYFVKYLNRLSTFTELAAAEKDGRARENNRSHKVHQRATRVQDPLDPLHIEQEEDLAWQSSRQTLLPGSFKSFKDIDLAGLACIFAESEFLQGVRLLYTRHNRETWPWRLAITSRIPETCLVEQYWDLLPQVSPVSRQEMPWPTDHPWRDMDWVEVAECAALVFGSPQHELDLYSEQQARTVEERKAAHGGNEAAALDMVAIQREAEELLPSSVTFPAPNDTLTRWYTDRALAIDRNAGQMIEARRLIQSGTDHHVPNLETISEDLEMLCKLLYEIKPERRSPEARSKWSSSVLGLSLEEFASMNTMEVVTFCLGMTDERMIVHDVRHLILPYLTVIVPRRWQRQDPRHVPGSGLAPGLDPQNPMSFLYSYLLCQSTEHLPWVGAVVEASKPVFESEERIISDDMDLSWLTLSCMYGCRTMDEWKVMSDMIVCLPIFEQTEQVDEIVDRVRRAELRKDIFLRSEGPQTSPNHGRTKVPQPLDPLNMFPAVVKYAPTPGLMQHALDTLEQHLTAAETLARYDLPVQLSWFLENSDSEVSQRQLITKMARLASGGPEKMGDRFESEDEWMLLLEDLMRLRGGEQGGGVLGLVSEQDIYKEYLAGVLSCGKFELAKAILFPPGLLPPIRLATAEKLVIDCSNEMYNNATSGNRHQGLMKMAYDCLNVLPETTNIRRELDLIEATNFMTSTYNLTAPGSDALILPLQIRSTENKLSLVRRLIMTNENAYRDHEAMLELAIKLTGNGHKKGSKQTEIQVVGMLIEAALKERNSMFALVQAERLMDLLKVAGAFDMNPDGSPKSKRLAKSGSFNSENGGISGRSSPSTGSARQAVTRLESRAGTSMLPDLAALPSLKGEIDSQPWEIFLRVGTESAGRNYNKRLSVVGYALGCCPPERIEMVLEIWRSLEMESVVAPVAEEDPRQGVARYISSAMAHGGGPLSDIMGRSNPGKSVQQETRREHSMNTTQVPGENGSRRDKLKSLVSSIWAS